MYFFFSFLACETATLLFLVKITLPFVLELSRWAKDSPKGNVDQEIIETCMWSRSDSSDVNLWKNVFPIFLSEQMSSNSSGHNFTAPSEGLCVFRMTRRCVNGLPVYRWSQYVDLSPPTFNFQGIQGTNADQRLQPWVWGILSRYSFWMYV